MALLFEVRPSDPLTYGVIAGLLAMVARATCYLPARRADVGGDREEGWQGGRVGAGGVVGGWEDADGDGERDGRQGGGDAGVRQAVEGSPRAGWRHPHETSSSGSASGLVRIYS